MAEKSGFGLEREMKIIESAVRHIFTPHQPINTHKLFFGRAKEVTSIIEQINTPGQHALLYGERGVGKTSLANITAEQLADLAGGLFRKRCDSTDTFVSIVSAPLKAKGFDVLIDTTQKTESVRGDANIGIPAIAGLAASGETQKMESTKGIGSQAQSPGWVAEQLADVKALFVIDEADAIRRDDDRRKLSELIKHLSDSGSPLKVLVVGIAETAEQLTGGHKSVHRCLRETKLNRMSDEELASIVVVGSKVLDLNFSAEAIMGIVRLSAGYPHFTHLLALKCAEDAIAQDRQDISTADLQRALSAAAQDAEGTLKRLYDDAVRSYQTDMHKIVLGAAAHCNIEGFSARDLRASIKEIYGRDVSQPSLNNYFKRLVSDSDSTILRRLAKGVYRFNDPRMPSYVRIVEGMLF